MNVPNAAGGWSRRLGPHLRGHLFLFDQRPDAPYREEIGRRLLLTAALLEALRLAYVTWLYPAIAPAFMLPVFVALALVLLRGAVKAPLSTMGLRRWRDWTVTERSYFVQVLVIANIVFPMVLAAPLRLRLSQSSAWFLWSVFVPYLFFGFYQELVYRGMLQRELVRRWGTVGGIGAANVLYTFGPLHAHYFAARASLAVPMFAAIFGIGLFFGILFKRSGNLWIVAIMHALGNAYIVGSQAPTR